MTALGVRAALEPRRWLAAALLLAVVAAPALALETIPVAVDQARIVKLPDRAATIVIGNPLIADISIQPGGIAVLTGKGYGVTNVIAMDSRGAVLMEKTVAVTGPNEHTVVVYKGVVRETYSCTPECSPRLTLGDGDDYFTKTITEMTTRNNQAMGAGAAAH
jgi:Flp pilus assembly secretin CpaC